MKAFFPLLAMMVNLPCLWGLCPNFLRPICLYTECQLCYLMSAQRVATSKHSHLLINSCKIFCSLFLENFNIEIMRKDVASILSTFITNTDNAIECLVVSSSFVVTRPKPYLCFQRANFLSTSILSALSIYSCFLFTLAILLGRPSNGPVILIPWSLQ